MASKARQLAQSASAPEGRKNIITNGAMNVAQRGTSETSSATSNYLVDRFRSTNSGGQSLTYSQESDAPDGFANSLKIKVESTFTTGATDLLGIGQLIEGQDLQHLKKGTSGALATTLSFHIKSNLTGNVAVELLDRDSAFRHIVALVNISSANTWEYKTVTFPGDTSGALDDDNAASLDFHIYFGAGSNATSGTLATSWASYVAGNRAAGLSLNSNNFGSSTDNFISITGVQLEVGSVATEFEHRSFGEELALCQRYFEKSYPILTVPGTSTANGCVVCDSGISSTSTRYFIFSANNFKVTKRATPSLTIYSQNGTINNISKYNSSTTLLSVSSVSNETDGSLGTFITTASGDTSEPYNFHWVADAEL